MGREGVAIEDESKMSRVLLAVVFLLYLVTVLWFTVLCRSVRVQTPKLELFWSYRLWFGGSAFFGREILGNYAMFGPFGFMLGELFLEGKPAAPRRTATAFFLTILFAFLFAGIIEGAQYLFQRGLFEWDDFLGNTLGAAAGFESIVFFKKG
ncbi:MAG: VanZ family protein [Lachnospiraceae bacterium]